MNPTSRLSRLSRRGSPPLRQGQRGISLLFVLFVAVLIFIVGGAGLRLLPTFLEYRAISSAIDRAVDEGGDAASIRRAFDRAAAIDDITSISGKDLDIVTSDGRPVVGFDYEKRVPLAGPVSLVVEYSRGETGN